MDITILLIGVIFMLLTVLIVGAVVFCVLVLRTLKRTVIRADLLADEQMNLWKEIAYLRNKAAENDTQRVKQDAVDAEAEEHANRLQEQHAAMMDFMPPGFGGSKK